MNDTQGAASPSTPSTSSARHRAEEPSALRATVAVIELAPETTIGRRGSKQTTATVSDLHECALAPLTGALVRLGGEPVAVVHTQLIGLLPPGARVIEKAQSELAAVAETLKSSPVTALATGLVDLRRVAAADTAVALVAGPALDAARDAARDEVSERIAGGERASGQNTVRLGEIGADTVPEGTPDFGGTAVGDQKTSSEWTGTASEAAICGVSVTRDDRASTRIRRIMELVAELDGEICSALARPEEVRLVVRFALPATEASEQRAADLALLLRERFEEQVRCAVGAGTVLSGTLATGNVTVNTVAGEPVVTAMDLLEYTQAGQVAIGGASADRLSTGYAVQPIGGVNRGGRRIPAGTTLLLWREYPVSRHGIFVGRESELEKIQSYLHSDTNETLHLTGAPGIGKTALVEQIVRSRPASSVLIVAGSDVAADLFSCVAEALSDYWDLPPRDAPTYRAYLTERLDSTRDRIWDDELLAEYDRLRHFMAHVLGLGSDVAVALDPESRYRGIHDALVVLLRGLQGIRILWVDDQQWIDAGSKRVLEAWVGGRDPRRLRVLTTVRTRPGGAPENRQQELSGLGRESREIKLSGLTDAAARALLEQRGTTGLIPKSDLNTIVDHCVGNPFFLDQCARFVADESAAGTTPVIPESVQDVILARIKRLSEGVREAIEMAAVLGLRFDMRILSAMLREERLPEALRSAQEEGFWESLSELNFIFCHTLIRDAVYDAQFEERRTELHAAAIRAFERVYSGETRKAHLYQLADHCERAGRTGEAIDYLAEAAEYAFEQYENDRAVALLRRRLDLAGDANLRAVAELAHALKRSAAWEEASQLLGATVAKSVPTGSVEEASAFADCCYEFADLLTEQGETSRAQEIVDLGLRALDSTDYDHGRSLLHRVLGLMHFRAEEYDQSIREYETSLEFARASGGHKTVARIANDIAVVHAKTGRHDEALAAFESTLQVARELNDIRGISSALNNIGFLYDLMGHSEKALPYFEEDLRRCVDAGLRQHEAIARGNIASTLKSLGRHEEATTYFRESIDIDRQIGFLPHKAYNLQQLGSSLIAMGDAEEGCDKLREAVDLAREIDFPMVRDKATELLEGCR